MSIAQTDLTESCTFNDVGDALSYELPRNSQVVIKRSSMAPTGSRATFVRASNNCLFLDESDTYIDEAFVPRHSSAQLRFNGGVLDVLGPARVSSIGSKGQFEGGGSATWTLPGPDVDSQGSSAGQQSTMVRDGDTFTGIGKGVRQEHSVLTIQVPPQRQGLATLHLDGNGMELCSLPGFPIDNLYMWANGGYLTVHNTNANYAEVESNGAHQNLEGLDALRYKYHTNGGTIHGPENPRGQGKIETNGGTIIAHAPRESTPGQKENTLMLESNGGPVTVFVPKDYKGSVRAKSLFNNVTVDGMPGRRSAPYHRSSELNGT